MSGLLSARIAIRGISLVTVLDAAVMEDHRVSRLDLLGLFQD